MTSVKQDETTIAHFATPDRELVTGEPDKPAAEHDAGATDAPTVTPPESGSKGVDEKGKHVHFGGGGSSQTSGTSSSSKRGLVSRRGGRYGSPARPPPTPTSATSSGVLEFKTYRSPQRKNVENDTIPSLCSTNSGISSDGVPIHKSEKEASAVSASKSNGQESEAPEGSKPSTISLDASVVDNTSPLASHDAVDSSHTIKRSSRIANRKEAVKEENEATEKSADEGGKRNVTFSPTPPTAPAEQPRVDPLRKTPTKSPARFHTLPSLADAKLNSPGGMFLSPYPPSPSTGLKPMPSFDKEDVPKTAPTEETKRSSEDEKAKSRDQDRERAVSTPTDFAFDFGKGHQHTASFDNSNVLAWLQSPTANGMFSPGGFASMANTPRGGPAAPRTPHTPTTSTSFFFSDVASLPRNSSEFASPRGDPKRGGQPSGYSNSMICISPLASSRRSSGNGATGRSAAAQRDATAPLTNFKDVFASPRQSGETRLGDGQGPRGLPLLGDSPPKGLKGRPRSRPEGNLESVHMAERDLMEDEDLSVLLQLASHSAPMSARDARPSSGSQVFRPGDRKGGEEAGLQLPEIGSRTGMDGGSKLVRKAASQGHAEGSINDFTPPPLGIRNSASGGSKEVKTKSDGKSKGKDAAGKQKAGKGGGGKKTGAKGAPGGTPPYPMPGHPPYPPHGPDGHPYYPMPGSMPSMPPGGSMRVVVGGPPPPPPPMSNGSSNSPPRRPGQASSPHRPHYGDSKYPMPPHYPPHMYPHHHMGGMPPHYQGYPPPPHHPGHMPMYSTQHPGAPGAKGGLPPLKKGKAKSPKGAKRPADGKELAASKKARKTSPGKGSRKKKTATGTADPVDRQKAAAAIAAVNAASGGSNDRAAALAAAIMRGVTMRPSGKWQAQLYYAGKSRYIGVFDTREKAALAYEIAREKLKTDNRSPSDGPQSLKATENAVNAARKAAFEGVNEKAPAGPPGHKK